MSHRQAVERLVAALHWYAISTTPLAKRIALEEWELALQKCKEFE